VKAEGWKLFCERMGVPPFVVWETLPGFDRLRRALNQVKYLSFDQDSLLRWVNAVRPKEDPEVIETPLTVERVAESNAEMYRQRAKWWGGKMPSESTK